MHERSGIPNHYVPRDFVRQTSQITVFQGVLSVRDSKPQICTGPSGIPNHDFTRDFVRQGSQITILRRILSSAMPNHDFSQGFYQMKKEIKECISGDSNMWRRSSALPQRQVHPSSPRLGAVIPSTASFSNAVEFAQSKSSMTTYTPCLETFNLITRLCSTSYSKGTLEGEQLLEGSMRHLHARGIEREREKKKRKNKRWQEEAGLSKQKEKEGGGDAHRRRAVLRRRTPAQKTLGRRTSRRTRPGPAQREFQKRTREESEGAQGERQERGEHYR